MRGAGSPTLLRRRDGAAPEVVATGVDERRQTWADKAVSADHKQVGVLYLGAAFSFLVLAIVELILIRFQLAIPDNTLLRPEFFNRLVSAYGATFIFLFGIPLAAGLASYVVPLQLGARTVAFPRLNALSFWLFLGGAITLCATFIYTPPEGGGVPLAPLADDAFLPSNGMDAWIAAAALVALSSVLSAINLVVTVRQLKAPGMAWRRLPLFSWAATVYSYVLLLVSPVLLAALVMLFIDRNYSGIFFDAGEGGSPVLWQHLVWLYMTSAYFVILLAGIGAISEILPPFSRKPMFGHGAMAVCFVALGAAGPLAWLQNMYPAPMASGWAATGMVFAVLLAIPLAVIVFNWLATLWQGSLSLRAPMNFALLAISALSVGLAAELMLSVVPVGWALDKTAFSSAATSFALVGGGVFGGLAALYYWFPKMTGRTMGESLARISLIACLVGVDLTFLPQFSAGLTGQPVDVYKYFDGAGLEAYNLVSAIGAVILGLGILLSLVNAVTSASAGARAGHDPWGGGTLEWFTTSPPPENNFDVVPEVRSEEPLRDYRAAIAARDWKPSQPAEREPVA
jgi:cytochrome c oxidase subunit I